METLWEPPRNLLRRDPAVVTDPDIEGPPLTDAMVEAAEAILGVRRIALDYQDDPVEPCVTWLDLEAQEELLLAEDFASFVDSLRPFTDDA